MPEKCHKIQMKGDAKQKRYNAHTCRIQLRMQSFKPHAIMQSTLLVADVVQRRVQNGVAWSGNRRASL
jgi:hypothetical protein